MASNSSLSSPTYDELLGVLKERIQRSQVLAATALNREIISLYCGALARKS